MKRIIIAALAIAAMAGCNKEVGLDSYDSGKIVNFSSQSISSRTYDVDLNETRWVAGDKIGIFSDGFTDDYFNVAYEAEASDAATPFSLVEGETPIIYPNAESGSVDFYAYYPYDSAAIDESKMVDISDQSDLTLIDFLTAYVSGVSYDTTDVSFSFEHKLARAVFDISITEDSSITSLEGLTAKLEGIETQGSYYTYGSSQGTQVSSSLSAAADVDLEVSVDEGYASATITAILHPANYTGSAIAGSTLVMASTPTLIFELNGKEYVIAFATALGAGDSHTFDVSFGFNEVTMCSTNIEPWGSSDEGSLGNLDASEYDIAYNSTSECYQIYTAVGLKAFANLVNKTADDAGATYVGFEASEFGKAHLDANGKLMNDIDLSSVCYEQDGSVENDVSWTPIGNNSNKYTGIFDGNGFEARNIYINSESDYQGLFGYITSSSAEVKNLGVVGGSVTGKSNVGGVVGYASSYSSVTECYNTSDVTGSSAYVGGVVGQALSYSSVTECYNTGDVTGSSTHVGGVVGYAYFSSVTECYNTGGVNSSSTNVGGVVGSANYSSSVTECYNTGDVTCSNSDSDNINIYVGGVVGFAKVSSSVTECYNTGDVTGNKNHIGGVAGYVTDTSVSGCYNKGGVTSSGNYVGGVVGYISASTGSTASITSCYSYGTVSSSGSSSYVGGAVGRNSENTATISYCYYNTETVDDIVTGTAPTKAVGGVKSNNDTADTTTVKGLTTAEMQAKDVVLWLNNGIYAYNETANGIANPIGAWVYNIGGKYPTIDPTATPSLTVDIAYNSVDSTYEIYTAAGLKAFANLVNGTDDDAGAMTYGVDFSTMVQPSIAGKLMDDIDLSSVCYKNDGTTDSDVSWIPIGDYSDDSNNPSYIGVFDGNGKVVKNLYINSESDYQGLFGRIYSPNAVVKNLGVVGGSVTGGSYVGGVVGDANSSSKVTECYNTSDVTGKGYVGGVAGYAFSSTMVTECYNTGNVTGSSYYVGGVVGYATTSSEVTECYNTGDVMGDNSYIGGVAGYIYESSVSGCYNKGGVTGSGDNIGGVAGYIGIYDSAASITSCYSCGTVSGSGSSKFVGGAVGCNYSGNATITACYYDAGTVGDNNAPTKAVGGQTTSGDTSDTVDAVGGYMGFVTSVMTGGTLYYCLNAALSYTWTAKDNDYPTLTWQTSSNE